MSEFNFKGGDFHIAMADKATAAILAATQHLSLQFAEGPQTAGDFGRVSGPDMGAGTGGHSL